MQNLKLGSLFDGSGGFPLAGMIAGITPVWVSEVIPLAIRVVLLWWLSRATVPVHPIEVMATRKPMRCIR